MTLQPLPNLPFDPAAVASSIALWAKTATKLDSIRYEDILHMKRMSVEEFFQFCQKHPRMVAPMDVDAWVDNLRATPRDWRGKRLSEATVYHMVSRLGAFYAWLIKAKLAQFNPVDAARPEAPVPYNSKGARSLSDDEQSKLIDALRAAAIGGDVVAKRDYAYLYWLFASGQRRNEIAQLSLEDFTVRGDRVWWQTRVKGGDVVQQELHDWELSSAITDYLKATDRKPSKSPAPLWLSHDRAKSQKGAYTTRPTGAGKREKVKRNLDAPVTTQALAKSAKRWAAEVGIHDFHLHMTRHTSVSQIYEQTGSKQAAQEHAGHARPSTTERYLHRIAVRKLTTPKALKDRDKK